jgi:hypothetical protein
MMHIHVQYVIPEAEHGFVFMFGAAAEGPALVIARRGTPCGLLTPATWRYTCQTPDFIDRALEWTTLGHIEYGNGRDLLTKISGLIFTDANTRGKLLDAWDRVNFAQPGAYGVEVQPD